MFATSQNFYHDPILGRDVQFGNLCVRMLYINNNKIITCTKPRVLKNSMLSSVLLPKYNIIIPILSSWRLKTRT